MGKARRKTTVKKPRNTTNNVTKSSEIAPSFKKNSDNEFQDALARRDFEKAKNILANAKNLSEWRRLNLEGLITISQGDLVATERILLRAIRFPDCGVKAYKNLVSVYSQMGRLREALPLAEKAHNMEPDNLDIGLLYINCLLDLAKADDVIRVADKLLMIGSVTALWINQIVPLPIFIIFVLRDLLILLGAAFEMSITERTPSPNIIGKITTASQIIYILGLILFEIFNFDTRALIFHISIALISILSLFSYFRWWLLNNFNGKNG